MSLKRLPKNIWVLALSQSLAMTCAPFMILVGGLLGADLAPDPKWATLPLALIILGSACTTVFAVLILKRFGRKRGSYFGFCLALLGACLGMVAAYSASFNCLLAGAFFLGTSLAFAQQYRFAALESLKDEKDFGLALSVMMTGGILSAFVGPEVGVVGKNWIFPERDFFGSFVLLAFIIVLGAGVFSFFENKAVVEDVRHREVRPLLSIVKNPFFIVSIIASAVSYGVMSLVMTATPISMYELCGYELSDTKFVIQSHIVAMFLPSLLGGLLMRYLGVGRLMFIGALLYGAMMLVALSGREIMHFWWSLLALGVGWNFLFVSGTALLPRSYRSEERFKVQAANDMFVFGIQAIGSLSAGWLLYKFGWDTLVWACCLPIVVSMVASVWLLRHEKRN